MLHELTFENCRNSRDPLVSCALEGVAAVIAGIDDVAIVIHSPQGCSSTVANAYDLHEIDFTKRKIACSRLFETDIIMGAADKLKDLIRQADRSFGAAVMFVVGTCAADIIGEDLDAVCRAMQPEVSARLIAVMAGGFHGDMYAGMDIGLSMLLPFTGFSVNQNGNTETGGPAVLSEAAGVIRSINLIAPQANCNPTWWADYAWVAGLIERFGGTVKCVIPRNTTLESLNRAKEADACILLSHDVGHEFAAAICGQSRLLLSEIALPVGIENSAGWIRNLGAVLGAQEEAENVIGEGEAKVMDILRKRALMIIPRYRNCRIAVSADCTIGIPLVRMLYLELEMIPELLLFRSDSPAARKLLERELSDLGIDPPVVFAADGWKTKTALASVRVDAMLGSSWEKYIAEELGIRIFFDITAPTNRDCYIDRPYFGYDGMLSLLELMGNDWESALRSRKITRNPVEQELMHENCSVCQ